MVERDLERDLSRERDLDLERDRDLDTEEREELEVPVEEWRARASTLRSCGRRRSDVRHG